MLKMFKIILAEWKLQYWSQNMKYEISQPSLQADDIWFYSKTISTAKLIVRKQVKHNKLCFKSQKSDQGWRQGNH